MSQAEKAVHREALRVAAELVDKMSFRVATVTHIDVKWPKFMGRKPQPAMRIVLTREGKIVELTARRPHGGLLMDFKVPHCGLQWTQESADGDSVPLRFVLRDVAFYLRKGKKS